MIVLSITINETPVQYTIQVQLAKKERTHELNSKFDKTYQIFFKVLSQFDIKKNRSLFV